MTPETYCYQKVGGRRSSIYYTALFLPVERRAAVFAVYALERHLGELVGRCADPATLQAALTWWHREVRAAYRGRPSHPVARVLARYVHEADVTPESFSEWIEGVAAYEGTTRIERIEELRALLARSRGAAAALGAALAACADARTRRFAGELGVASGLAEVVCNVGLDARRRRVLLPHEDLARFAVAEADLVGRRHNESFQRLMAFQVQRARRWCEALFEKPPAAQSPPWPPGCIAAAIECARLEEVAREGYRVLDRGIDLTPLRKLWIAWRTYRRLRPSPPRSDVR